MSRSMSRRDLLRGGLAVVGGLVAVRVAGQPGVAWAADAAAGKPRIRLGTVTYMVAAKMDLPTLLDACEKSGMEGVELRTGHAHGVEPTLDAAGRAKVKEQFAKSKVALVALGTACEFHSPDPAVVKKHIADAKQFIDLAADLGAWGVKVRPNGLRKDVPEEQTLRQIGEALREVGEAAKAKNIQIVVECHGSATQEPARMAKIMEFCGHPSVGLCWNSNAGDVKNGSIKAGFDLCKAWIRHVHCRDLEAKDYNWPELFQLLKGMNYTGYTMLEAQTKKDPVEYLKERRALWEKLMG